MATAEVVQYCNICEYNNVSNTAVTWCPECDDFLCSACDRVHAGSKALKQHVVIKIENYKNLPPSILSIKTRCYSHKNKYEFHCTTHCEPCCLICIRNEHRDCKQVCPISEVTDGAKSSTATEHLARDLLEIDAVFETVKSNIRTNIAEISKQKIKFLTEISKVRKSIDNHLDTIEKQIIDDLTVTEQKLQVQLQQLMSDFERKRDEFSKFREDLKKVKQYGSNIQTYLGVNEMMATTDKTIKKLQGTLEFNHHRLDLAIHSRLQSFQKIAPYFGKVSVVQNNFHYYLMSGIKSQVYVPTPEHLVRKPTRKTTIQLPSGNKFISGSEILHNGKLLFADAKNNKLMMYSADGNYEKGISLSGKPYEVICTDRTVVAVTLPEKREIVFVNVTTNACIKSVNTVHRCFGSDTYNTKLAVRAFPSYTSDHIIFYSLMGDFISRVDIPRSRSANISVQDNRITCSDWKKNTVHMYTTGGEKLWTFKDEKVLRRPIGIAIDKHKNVFVAGNATNKVVLLSPDGRFLTEFLSEKDGLRSPYSLRLNIDRDELLVCNENGPAFLFSLRYT